MKNKLLYKDQQLLLWIQQKIRRKWLTRLMKIITFLGDGGILWITTAAILFFRPSTRFTAISILLALCLSILITNLLLKNLVARTRPHDKIQALRILIRRPQDFSFPSGHTSSSFASATVLLCTAQLWIGVLALAIAVLIAFSRLYLGAHFPSDVFIGIILGITFGFLAVFIARHTLNASWMPFGITTWFYS